MEVGVVRYSLIDLTEPSHLALRSRQGRFVLRFRPQDILLFVASYMGQIFLPLVQCDIFRSFTNFNFRL